MSLRTKLFVFGSIVLLLLTVFAWKSYPTYSLDIEILGNSEFRVLEPTVRIDSYNANNSVLGDYSSGWSVPGGFRQPTRAIISWKDPKVGERIRKFILPALPAELKADKYLVLCFKFEGASREALFYWGDYFTSDESYMKGKVGDCDIQATQPIRGEAIETDDWEKVFGETWPVQ